MALRNNRVLPRLMNAVGMCKDKTIIYQYASIELYRLRFHGNGFSCIAVAVRLF